MSVNRPLNTGDTQYAQMTLDAIAPYIKQIYKLTLTADNIEQLRPLLEFCLEKGAPRSITRRRLYLSKAALAFPETEAHLNHRFSQYLGGLEILTLSFVGLDWSSAAFNKLTLLSLFDLPPSGSPTLMQLSRILSACPSLYHLQLERIAIITSPDETTLEPVEHENLTTLSLNRIDISKILSIVFPKSYRLRLTFRDVIDDADALGSLRLFISRVHVEHLSLKLSETRSDTVLAQLLNSITSPVVSITLEDMDLREHELNDLSLTQSGQNLPSALVDTTSRFPGTHILRFEVCTIRTTHMVFHSAVSVLPWKCMVLDRCKHTIPQERANGTNEMFEHVSRISDFAVRLNELLGGRSVVIY